MPKHDFDDLIDSEREITVRGKTFHYRELSPEEVFADDEMPANGDSPWDISDRQIMRYLPESEHAAWLEIRADKENPVTIRQMNAIFAWLWEEATGIPLPQPEISAGGAGTTATTSMGKSRSRAVTPKG